MEPRTSELYDKDRAVSKAEMAEMLGTTRYHGGRLDTGAGHLHPLNYALGLARAAEEAGEQTSSSSHFSLSINGRQVQTSSSKTRYLYRVTPKAKGRVVIPPVSVEVDGETLQTKPLILNVTRSETGDLLLVELEADKDHVYVGEPSDVTLRINLSFFALGRCRQRDLPEYARTDALGHGLDDTTLAGRIAAFEYDDDAQAFALDPFLQMRQLFVQLAKFLFVVFPIHFWAFVNVTCLCRIGE